MDWFPLYPAKYRGDTMHLSLAEHGAYMLLIQHYMASERPIPDDDKIIARIVGCDRAEWLAVAENVRAFFNHKDGLLLLEKCERELQAQSSKRSSKIQAGRKGGLKTQAKRKRLKANKNKDIPSSQPSSAKATPVADNQLHTYRQTEVGPTSINNGGATSVRHRSSQVGTVSDVEPVPTEWKTEHPLDIPKRLGSKRGSA